MSRLQNEKLLELIKEYDKLDPGDYFEGDEYENTDWDGLRRAYKEVCMEFPKSEFIVIVDYVTPTDKKIVVSSWNLKHGFSILVFTNMKQSKIAYKNLELEYYEYTHDFRYEVINGEDILNLFKNYPSVM